MRLVVAGWDMWPMTEPWPDIIHQNIVGLADRIDPVIEVADDPVGQIARQLAHASGSFAAANAGRHPNVRGRILLAFPGPGDRRCWELIDRALAEPTGHEIHALPFQATFPGVLVRSVVLPVAAPVRDRAELNRLRYLYDDRMPSARKETT